MKDVQDEAPVLEPSTQTFRLNQDAGAGTLIHVVQAYDPDVGDTITLSFGGWQVLGCLSVCLSVCLLCPDLYVYKRVYVRWRVCFRVYAKHEYSIKSIYIFICIRVGRTYAVCVCVYMCVHVCVCVCVFNTR